MLVRDSHNKKWMLPGGQIDRGESPIKAMKREFKEETGFSFPEGLRLEEFNYRNHTLIYIGKYNDTFPVFNQSKTKRPYETDMVAYARLDPLINGTSREKYPLKSYVFKSLWEMRAYGVF